MVKRSMRGVMRAQRRDCPKENRAAGVIRKWSANSCSCRTTAFILRREGERQRWREGERREGERERGKGKRE